jgi:membrane protein implicated in regulation of membrane protease activity
VLTLVAVVLALLVLPAPCGVLAVVAAAVVDLAERVCSCGGSRRRRVRGPAAVGTEAIVGRSGAALGRLDALCLNPIGQVRVHGEILSGRSAKPIDPGEIVTVSTVDGLVLVVEPARRP